jgi:hypothetical protein
MTDQDPIEVFSYGGGQQSNAALALAAQGRLPYKKFLFCNVGDDSEDPRTLDYVRNVAIPFAERHGLEIVELRRFMKRTGEERTLLQRLERPSRTIDIPVRMDNGAPVTGTAPRTTRSC